MIPETNEPAMAVLANTVVARPAAVGQQIWKYVSPGRSRE